jgi:hypothetical protein
VNKIHRSPTGKFQRVNGKFTSGCCCCQCDDCTVSGYTDGIPDGLVDGIWPPYYQVSEGVTLCPISNPGCYAANAIAPLRRIQVTSGTGTTGSLAATRRICLARHYPASGARPAHALYHCMLPLSQYITYTEYDNVGSCVNPIVPVDLMLVTNMQITYTPQSVTKTIAASPGGAVRVSNVTTYTTTTAHGLSGAGNGVLMSGVSSVGGTEFNGARITVTTPTTTTFTVSDPGVNDTGGGGTMKSGGGVDAVIFTGPWNPASGSIFNAVTAPGTVPNSYRVTGLLFSRGSGVGTVSPWSHSFTATNDHACSGTTWLGGGGSRVTTPCTIL